MAILNEESEMSKVYQGRPRIGEDRPTSTVVRFTITEEMKAEDQEECDRLGYVTARSGNVNVSLLYRTMRDYWYSLPVSERKAFVKALKGDE